MMKKFQMYISFILHFILLHFAGMLIFIMLKFGLFLVCMFELFDFLYFIQNPKIILKKIAAPHNQKILRKWK